MTTGVESLTKPNPMTHQSEQFPTPPCCERMNRNTSEPTTFSGDLAITVKKTFKSNAAASTVFGRALDLMKTRYSSTSG